MKSHWVLKWTELKRLVTKKYGSHIALIGLELHEFSEWRGCQILLKIHPRHSFLLGYGSKLTALNMALRTVRKNQETKLAKTVGFLTIDFLDTPRFAKPLKKALRIIKECEFEKEAKC